LRTIKLSWSYFRHAETYGFQWKQITIVANYGLANLIQFLLDDGADVNVQCDGFDNALYEAGDRGYVDIDRLLAEKGANVNALGGYSGNALYVA
jgi:hypothetical protein